MGFFPMVGLFYAGQRPFARGRGVKALQPFLKFFLKLFFSSPFFLVCVEDFPFPAYQINFTCCRLFLLQAKAWARKNPFPPLLGPQLLLWGSTFFSGQPCGVGKFCFLFPVPFFRVQAGRGDWAFFFVNRVCRSAPPVFFRAACWRMLCFRCPMDSRDVELSRVFSFGIFFNPNVGCLGSLFSSSFLLWGLMRLAPPPTDTLFLPTPTPPHPPPTPLTRGGLGWVPSGKCPFEGKTTKFFYGFWGKKNHTPPPGGVLLTMKNR